MAWQITYITSIVLFTLIGMIFPFFPFKSSRALKIFGIVRSILFILLICSCIIPSLHWFIFILPNSDDEYVGTFSSNLDFLVGAAIMGALYIFGLVFWVAKIPERFNPGKFDLFFSSHQIWHTFIVAASCVWYYYSLVLCEKKAEKFRDGVECPS
jgi:adiponectin receptor